MYQLLRARWNGWFPTMFATLYLEAVFTLTLTHTILKISLRFSANYRSSRDTGWNKTLASHL